MCDIIKIQGRNVNVVSGCFCPLCMGERDVGCTRDFLQKVATKMAPWVLPTMTHRLAPILAEPDAVWEGVRDPDPGDDRWGYCYCKHYPTKLDEEGNPYPNRSNQVLCAYTNADFLLFEFQWCPSELVDDEWLPEGHLSRFGERIK